jgi:hypothetical protein
METADMDGNGLSDLVVVEDHGSTLSVFLRNPWGGFEDPLTVNLQPFAAWPFFCRAPLAVGDITNDGVPDVILADGMMIPELLILPGAGDGTFEEARPFLLSGAPCGIGLSDVDRDGMLDIITVPQTSGTQMLHVFLGLGDSLFADPWTAELPPGVDSLLDYEFADFDGDGSVDFAAAGGRQDGRIVLGFGTGDGSFRLALAAGGVTSRNLNEIEFGDVNGDGVGDLVVCSHNADAPDIALSRGEAGGAFLDPELLMGPRARGIRLADLDEDGLLDLVCESSRTGSVQVRLANDALEHYQSYLGTEFNVSGGVIMDVDEDGHQDCILPSTGGRCLVILKGKGDGTLNAPRVSATYWRITSGVPGDFDEDGIEDIAAIGRWDDGLALFRGTEEPPWFSPDEPLALCEGFTELSRGATADLNRDGHLDLVVARYREAELILYFGNGDGSFGEPSCLALPLLTGAWGVATADFDEDGQIDIAVNFNEAAYVGILYGLGDGTFRPLELIEDVPAPRNLIAHDLDEDGHMDMVWRSNAGETQTLGLLRGRGDGTFSLRILGEAAGAEGLRPLQIADATGDGIEDVITAAFDPNAAQGEAGVVIFPGEGGGHLGAPLGLEAGSDVQ